MSETKTSQILHPFDTFTTNMRELVSLVSIYSHVSSNPVVTSTGELCQTHTLLKSGVIFIVTCWDEFIKQLVISAFDFMLAHAKHPDVFPSQVKIVTSESLPPSHPDRFDDEVVRLQKQKARDSWDRHLWKQDIWRLAGDGWLELLRSHKDKVLEQYVGQFQSPRPHIVDNLFARVIGLRSLSSYWAWPGMSCDNAKKCLNILLNLRGDIVHRNQSHRPVDIEDVDYFSLLVNKLAGISANVVREYVYQQTGKSPWTDSGILDVPCYLEARCS